MSRQPQVKEATIEKSGKNKEGKSLRCECRVKKLIKMTNSDDILHTVTFADSGKWVNAHKQALGKSFTFEKCI